MANLLEKRKSALRLVRKKGAKASPAQNPRQGHPAWLANHRKSGWTSRDLGSFFLTVSWWEGLVD